MRNFPNFIDAYLDYANDAFTPRAFNEWSALSVVAGALERKVWLPWSDTFAFYPNVYVLLVALPGAGKSVALNRAVQLLQEMNAKTASLNIMPNQATEAKFIELLGHGKPFTYGTRTVFQNAAYYWASEASNSLRNIFGDFIACLTDFYDCPSRWQRATKKDGKTIELKNVCVNMLAGSTFDYLGKLVNDDNIMGGFASRPIYVIHQSEDVADQEFQLGGIDAVETEARRKYRAALVEDLTEINKMVGQFTADAEFAAAWREWRMQFERKRVKLQSEHLQSLLVRTNTNMLKTSMLLSAAESGDMVLRLRHWERARLLIDKVVSDIPRMLSESRAQNADRNPKHIPELIAKQFRGCPEGLTEKSLEQKISLQGIPMRTVQEMVNAMVGEGRLVVMSASAAGRILKLVENTDHNL